MVTVQLDNDQADTIAAKVIHDLYFDMIKRLEDEQGYLLFTSEKHHDKVLIQNFMKCLSEVHNYLVTEDKYI